MPKRIQMSRQHPWRADNPDAVIIARPSKWGNPYAVRPVSKRGPFDVYVGDWFCGQATDLQRAREIAVERFRYAIGQSFHGLDIAQARAELAGRDLACWCPLDQPCHADVLLELANGDPA